MRRRRSKTGIHGASVQRNRGGSAAAGEGRYVRKTNRRRHYRNHKRRYGIRWRRFIPFVLFLVTGVVSLALLVNYGIHSLQRWRDNRELAAEYSEAFVEAEIPLEEPTVSAEPTAAPLELKNSYRDMSGQPISKIQNLYSQNHDLVGWLYIKGIVDLPVVYRDNEFYLTHNFKGQKDKGGALFLDENHPLTEETQNLVIHGHNMHDSSMFGIVSSYAQLGVVKGNPFATFSTMYAPEHYVIFAVVRVDPNVDSHEYFGYIGNPTFSNAEDFYQYIDEVRKRSMFDIPVDVVHTDSILTLATCVEDDRLAVFFRRVREGEGQSELRAQVEQANIR